MKIGVALSGCDTGGACAYWILTRLAEAGFEPKMISACGIAAGTSLLYSWGAAEAGAAEAARILLGVAGDDPGGAVAAFAGRAEALKGEPRCPIALHGVHMGDGGIYSFTDSYVLTGARLRTMPLDQAGDALCSTISPGWGIVGRRYGGARLCDYSLWHGCPVYPLRMAGVEKVLSIAFLPPTPETPYERLITSRTEETGNLADLHLVFHREEEPSPGDFAGVAEAWLSEHLDAICLKLLF